MSTKTVYVTRKAYDRDGYHRAAYTRADGTRVKATYIAPTHVKASKVPDRGFYATTTGHKVPPHKQVIPKMVAGKLAKYGYSMSAADTTRHRALKKAANQYGYATTVRRLNAIRVLNKTTNPKVSKTAHKDMKYLKANREKLGL